MGAPLIEELIARGPVLTDGAWGTELQARGLGPGELPDAWNLEHPERVEEVARAYVRAGSRVILTNTFRANRIALAEASCLARLAELNAAGVAISRRAAGGQTRVFASMGPCGKLLAAREIDEARVWAAFVEQAEALAAAGADAIAVETMGDLAEARLAVRAARTTGLPVVACMAFGLGKARDRTLTGVTPVRAAEELTDAGADVIGTNCGTGIEDVLPICAQLAGATDRPIWVKPNAGLPELEHGEVVYRTTPEAFAAAARKLVEAGAHFIGGCCGTSPRFIEALRTFLES